MSATLEILYIGSRHRDDVAPLAEDGTRLREVETVYEGIVFLKRHYAGAVVVEFAALGPAIDRAIAALHAAAGDRPLLVVMTVDQWEEVRAAGLLRHEEVLLRPFYPDELRGRVQRAALPPPSRAVTNFRGDADRLAALMQDVQQLNRLVGDLSSLAHRCASIVKTRLRAGRVSIFLKEPSGDEFRAWEAERLEPRDREKARIRLGEGVAGALAAKRRVALVREAGRDGPGSPRAYDGTSYVIAPLVDQRTVIGVICATDRLDGGAFTRDDQAYMEALADAVTTTIHNALRYRAADELTTIDELTQLFNRRYFNRALPQELVRARRYEHDLTLAIIDIDYFKQYNDSNGHQAGDHALAAVARILKDAFRQGDIVVRLGGEEFAVIMPATRREDGNGVGVIDRARRLVEEAGLTFTDSQGARRTLTVSGGVATYPKNAENAEELYRRADDALYRAKNLGRNRIEGAGGPGAAKGAG